MQDQDAEMNAIADACVALISVDDSFREIVEKINRVTVEVQGLDLNQIQILQKVAHQLFFRVKY